MMRMMRGAAVLAAVCSTLATSGQAWAVLSFTVDPNGWPDANRRNAAVNSLTAAVSRYNAYGDFGNFNIWAYYNSGIPTAQASYGPSGGSIGYGGTWPNERVTMHEMAHYLGSGTYGLPANGTRSEALIDQFDGIEANFNGDGTHFWPYGLNYDTEWSEIAAQRHVAMVYAQRRDMGIGANVNPSPATTATLTASDAPGESGFNHASKWSNTHFAQPGTTYSTGNFFLRTPASGNSFTFVGDSLTINNANGIDGGLLYKGTGANAVTSFKQLNLAGGYVRHASSSADVFNLAGKVVLGAGTSTIHSAQGAIVVAAELSGAGSLVKKGSFVTQITGTATYAGSTTIESGVLRLAQVTPLANYTFDTVSGATVSNAGSGGSAMNGTLAAGATIATGGRSGNALSVSGGASMDVNHRIAELSPNTNWTVTAWVKTTTAGATILSKSDGGWAGGNTIFYLGDGSAGGSGGLPSSVRYGGGFFQTAPGSTPANDGQWRHVTYVNSVGNFAIYVDGAPQSLSAANAGLLNQDMGSILRLGATTNTFVGDGTVHFNGLIDEVRIYNRALSQTQVAALFNGANAVGSLPTSTTVNIAAGATLDLNGATQQVAAVTGPAGSYVFLGAGRLIVNPSADASFAGNVSGSGGSFVKTGQATFTLAGSNAYTGETVIDGGTLVIGNNARTPILVNAGADIRSGALVFDYAAGSTPAATVGSILDAGFDLAIPFSSGKLRNTTLPSGMLLGWTDDTSTSTLTIRTTRAGDANLDLVVDFNDLLTLAQHYDTTVAGRVWDQGDFNYDGLVNFNDLLALAQNYGSPASFANDWALVQSLVPEPATTLLAVALFAPRCRTR
jgi:autotransporter-associated beta strand protein